MQEYDSRSDRKTRAEDGITPDTLNAEFKTHIYIMHCLLSSLPPCIAMLQMSDFACNDHHLLDWSISL